MESSPAPPLPPHARSSPARSWPWIVALVPVVLIVTLGGVLSLGALYHLSGEAVALTPQDRALVLDIYHLTAWMEGYTPDIAGETLTKKRYIDRSYEIEYTYDRPEDEEAPYLAYTVAIEPSVGDARSTYLSFWGGTRVAFYALGGVDVEVEEKNDLFRWGDDSRFAVLVSEQGPFGNVFVATKGKVVVYLLVSGIYFDDGENVGELLAPYLEKLEDL